MNPGRLERGQALVLAESLGEGKSGEKGAMTDRGEAAEEAEGETEMRLGSPDRESSRRSSRITCKTAMKLQIQSKRGR